MTETDRLYLDIIQPFPPGGPDLFDSANLEAVKSMAKRHGQFMLVYWRLQGTACGNPAVTSFLKENEAYYLSGAALAARQNAVERNVISILGRESIPSLVIKGSALAKDVYGDINSRCSSDIDMLVKYGDAATVDRIMSQAGFVRQGGRDFEFDLLRIHHSQYLAHRHNIFVEMHWHFAIPCFFPLSYDDIWSGVKNEGIGRYTLSPEMNIIMLLMHHHSHAFRHLGVLTDILWALHGYREVIDWRLFLQAIKKFGLANTAAITCGQIEELWREYADELPLTEFRHAGLSGPGRMGRYFRIYPGMAAHPTFIDKIAKRLVLDDWRRVFLSFFTALFPPPASIRRADIKENRLLAYFRYMKEIIGHWPGRKQGR